MKQRLLILVMLVVGAMTVSAANPWYGINYDQKAVAAMVSAYGVETATEMYYSEQVKKILDRYSAAEVAAAGIFTSKYLDRKALTDLGIWISPDENYYYRRIYTLVSAKIMPKIWVVAKMMLRSPQNALYWGSYLFKVCAEVESLCMQFESIVTNSSLSFRDLVFLQIAPQFQPLFNLSKSGGIDWEKFFDDLGSIPNNFTKEKMQQDIDKLYQMGVNIANAGMENMMGALLGGSSFNDIISGNLPAIVNAVESSYHLYKSMDANMKGTLMSLIGGPEAVAQLFNIDNYNMTSWMTDYVRESMGQYYTQRWYIYRRDAGSEILCNYMPPTDDNSILYGSAWTRFNTTNPNYYPTSAQTEQILRNSENHAGWSRSRVNQLNASNDGFSYNISTNRYAYILNRGSSQYGKAYAYAIKVVKSWNHVEEVYEELFDSYTMDKGTFESLMNARLADFNDNEDGFVYQIGYDPKRYYYATDDAKLQGTESVIISVTCHDGFTLAQGSTQYKCKKCGSSLNAHSKECAMSTTLSGESLDTSEFDALEQQYNTEISSLQSQIDALESENSRLLRQISNASLQQASILRQQYNENKRKIDALKQQLAEVRQKLKDLQQAKEEAAAGEAEQTDDRYRIPAIMQECKTAFDLNWTDEGHWEGYTFVRTATSGGMNGTITFKASLSIARKPKYFLGIKIHRAILQIDWTLSAEISDTQVVEVIELDPNKSERENSQIVNAKISEIARDYPDCEVTTEYVKSAGMEEDTSSDTYHLLWSSDRLEIARQVEVRLAHIYADLVSLEKMMNYKLSIVDYLRGFTPYINDMQGKKMTIIEEAHQRWMLNARNTKTNPAGGNGGGSHPNWGDIVIPRDPYQPWHPIDEPVNPDFILTIKNGGDK